MGLCGTSFALPKGSLSSHGLWAFGVEAPVLPDLPKFSRETKNADFLIYNSQF